MCYDYNTLWHWCRQIGTHFHIIVFLKALLSFSVNTGWKGIAINNLWPSVCMQQNPCHILLTLISLWSIDTMELRDGGWCAILILGENTVCLVINSPIDTYILSTCPYVYAWNEAMHCYSNIVIRYLNALGNFRFWEIGLRSLLKSLLKSNKTPLFLM